MDEELPTIESLNAHHSLDVRGYFCPVPLLQTRARLSQMETQESLHVISSDPSSEIDFAVLGRQKGLHLSATWREGCDYHYLIEKRH